MKKFNPIFITGLTLFLHILSFSQDHKGRLQISGSNNLSCQWMNKQSPYASVPIFYIRDEFSTRLKIMNIPLYAGVLLTTENESFRQSMNQYYLRFAADDWSGSMPSNLSDSLKKQRSVAERIFSKVYRLEIGTFFPDYSRIAFSGLPVNGINIAIMPGPLFLAFSYGSLNRATENTPVYQSPYQRRMLFASLGAGKPRQSHFFLNLLHTYDREATVQPDTFSFVRPADTVVFGGDTIIHTTNEYQMTSSRKENFIAGADVQLSFLKRKIIAGGELSVSMFTPDKEAMKAEIKGAPDWISGYFDPRLGSHVDYSYLLRMDIRLKTTSIGASFLRVMPGYESLTNPYIRRDSKELNVNFSQSIFKRKLMLRASYKNRDEGSRGQFQNVSFSATFQPGKWPTITVGVFPSVLRSETYSYTNTLYQLSMNYPWKISSAKQNTSVYFSYQDGKYNTSEEDRSMKYWNASVNHRSELGKSAGMTVFANFSQNMTSEILRFTYTLGCNLRYSISKKIKATIGTSFVYRQPGDITLRTNMTASYDAGKAGLFSIKGQHIYYHYENPGRSGQPGVVIDFSYLIRFQ